MFEKNTTIVLFLASLPTVAIGACVGDTSLEHDDPSKAGDASSNTGDASSNTGDASSNAGDASSKADDASGIDADASPPPNEDAAVPDASPPISCPAEGCKSCADLLARNAGLASGVYSIDPDGAGTEFSAMDAYCDGETDGGGWTLVLNYVHADGTTPNVAERSTLPILESGALGDDESTSKTAWGHASPALVKALAPKDLRFYGATSAHTRIVNFKTNATTCVSYATTGVGSCKGLETAFIPLAGHTAHLPAEADAWMSDKGALALTTFPFYKTSTYHWSIRGGAARWEVDSYSDSNTPAGKFNTIHRVFVR